MSKYSFYYFGLNGRATIPRAILSYAKADWENHLVKMEEWPTLKKSGLCEFEQLPVLEIDGKKYCESYAIMLYLAEKFDLLGKNVEENYEINNILFATEDYLPAIFKIWHTEDESKKKEFSKKAEEKLIFFIKKFEAKIVKNKKGKYYLGEKLTLADIVLGTALPDAVDLLKMEKDTCEKFAPNLGKYIKDLRENELKEFFEKYYIK